MMADRMLADAPVRRDGDRLLVEIRIPWYRALPLSSVTKIRLTIDGREVDHHDILFRVNDHEYRLDDLPPLWQEWWYVLDSAWLSVPVPTGWTEGEHAVDLHLGIYIPYLPVGPYILCVEEDCSKTLEAIA